MRRSKRIGFVVLLLIASVLALRLSPRLVRAAGAGSSEIPNGDTNSDGRRDIGDAIFLLSWLFLGGPEPESVVCEAPASGPLPFSGQIECFDQAGEKVSCIDESAPGQDAAYVSGCTGERFRRFRDVGDGTIEDLCAGLLWQKDTFSTPGRRWTDALLHAESLILASDGTWHTDPEAAAAHGGILFDDWRLPDARELSSLVDYGRFDPSVDPLLVVAPAGYWSSTTFAGSRDEGWCINFFDGDLEPIAKAASLKVIVVRDHR
jgi:hypothetical protein